MTGKEFKQLYEQGILAPETEYILNNTESEEEYIIYINNEYILEADIQDGDENIHFSVFPITILDDDNIEVNLLPPDEETDELEIISYEDLKQIQEIMFNVNERVHNDKSANINELLLSAALDNASMIQIIKKQPQNSTKSEEEINLFIDSLKDALEKGGYIYTEKDDMIEIYFNE